ncbi:ABC-2 type transport system ATP-binding protein [Methanolinea mesophila]|uniref:ATP-binding cassette domain-containing protein n=1 Tax=Methanolinea mesophila TaxID=547055 RepID=UPI001AE82274|nr:ATP-binding cassette domain-containing protein [Methanolinea mesophila]MBP1929117.1 ABC-2 type transport system ATP-binding protein [Methanolinea mesophila]
MSGHIIEVEGLRHRYNNFVAVDGISFSVDEGEIFSFLGPNGAGKSTAINVLTTLLRLQEGSASIAGYDVARSPGKVRESIGIVFQEVTLDRDMTCGEILKFHGMLYEMPRERLKKRVDELLDLVQLESKRNTLTKHLSGGMKRRLEIARGLMTRPRVLFLDEPTIGLDPQTRMRMWDYIKEVNEEGTTIFLTTHYMDEADQLSDRISIIDYGKIITTGRAWELKNTLGKDLIYLETSDNAATATLLRDMGSVKEVTPKGNGLLIMVTEDGTKLLPQMVEELRSRGVQVSTVNLKKPSMDDVFVSFTGRELRDEGAERTGSAISKAGGRSR